MDESLIVELNGNVVSLQEEVREERRTRTRQITMSRVAIVIAILVGVVGAGVNWWDRESDNHSRCLTGNKVRADILAGFDQFTDQIAGIGNQPTDEAAKRARAELVATFKKQFRDSLPNLQPRDC